MFQFKTGLFIFCIIFLTTFKTAALETGPYQNTPSVEFDSENDSGFYYTIQTGDTLWGLSQKFYHSQWDWPGLWEMNKDIKNPHWIYPGNKIRLFLKKETARYQKAPEVRPLADVDPSFVVAGMDYAGFIRKTAVPALGTITREKNGKELITVKDIIYIKPSGKGSLIPEETCLVFSTRKINETINQTRIKGVKHQIKAKVKILEHQVNFATAVVVDADTEISTGDKIMALYPRENRLTVEESPAPIDASIICSEDDTVLLNDQRIAFIDRGRAHNVKPGQIYSVFQALEPSYRQTRSSSELTPVNIGKLIVLHTEETTSTVLILSSTKEIHPGDEVR